ncbi:unnamed protein product [Rhizophagus irregularis]|nr:unnamed protein product [Rhizophagus irregularis]
MNFGKCHQYLDPKNSTSGLQCKCFMFRATENGKYLCACCGHDRNYHEPPSQHFDSTNRTSIPTSIQSSIAAQEPDELDVENFEINVEELNTRVRVDRKNVFKVINLFNVGPKPKIPRGIKKFKKKGIMNSIQFSEDSSNGIKSVIEAAFPWLKSRNWVFFRCDSTSVLVVADIPAKGWNIKALTKISGCRKKLYIGVVSSSSVELVDESNIIIDQGSSTSASTSSSSQPVPMNTTDCGAFTMPYTGMNAPTNFIDQVYLTFKLSGASSRIT